MTRALTGGEWWLLGLRGLRGLRGPMRLMGLIGLMGVMGCSRDSEEELVVPESAQGIPVEVRSLVAGYEEAARVAGATKAYVAYGAAAVTRAWEPPTGYSLYNADESIISINFTQDAEAPMQGYFFKSSDQWRVSLPEDEELAAESYYLYGYVPHSAGMSCELSSSATPGDNSAYSDGAVMKIKNVPTVLPSDLCVVVGAKNGKDDYVADGDYSVTGLTRGHFEYAATATSGEDTGNYVYLLFDHLYAALRIGMRVHDDYAALRTIKVKELRLQTTTDEGAAKAKTDITVTLAANDTGSDPITSITFTPQGEAVSDGVVFTSATGQTLTSAYSTFQSHFMPHDVTKLLLTSTYDVYDKNVTPEHPEGNLIRKDCKATNTLDISRLFDRQTVANRGVRYTVNITIRPTYLYMLSEPDLDSPTMVVE